MPINRLTVDGFRNLEAVDVRFGSGVNVISGENGAGKTSILEVLYTMSTGRSFRTRRFKNLISYTGKAFQLFAEFSSEGLTHRLGIERAGDGSSIFRLDGAAVPSAGELAQKIPCQVINSQSLGLIDGGPGERRSFLDWLVFHVKPSFRSLHGNYARCLKHRNTLLRGGASKSEFEVWNLSLAELGEQIDRYREEVLLELAVVAERYLGECGFIGEGDLTMNYQPGWDRSQPLRQQLESHHQRDEALGFTSLGPHKSDIRFTFNKKPLADVFSRGQQKVFVAALHLSQLTVFRVRNSKSCLMLVDDLPSELDKDNIERFFRWLEPIKDVQTFVTSIEADSILSFFPSTSSCTDVYKVFHVKHGQVIEQPCQWSKT